MRSLVDRFERYTILSLLIMMIFVVFLSTVELAVIIVEELFDEPRIFLLDISELLRIFGFFFLILIGLEIIESIRAYLSDHYVHVEIIFLVAIIAIARKVILVDMYSLAPLTLIGIASLIVSLSIGYFLLKKVINVQKHRE